MATELTNLGIFPAMRFGEDEYAQLEMRLDLFNDRIVATRYQQGRAGASFIADPLAVAQALNGFDIDSGLLPENVLFWQRREGAERIGLWLPPQVWPVRIESRQETVAWRVPLPGLVLVGHRKHYELYAVLGKDRPGPESDLFVPPCPNVSGLVCSGNVKFPVAGAATIEEASWLFFESGFNGHLANGKSRKYPDDITRMWRVLNRIKAAEYPLADLVPMRMQLKGLLK